MHEVMKNGHFGMPLKCDEMESNSPLGLLYPTSCLPNHTVKCSHPLQNTRILVEFWKVLQILSLITPTKRHSFSSCNNRATVANTALPIHLLVKKVWQRRDRTSWTQVQRVKKRTKKGTDRYFTSQGHNREEPWKCYQGEKERKKKKRRNEQ